MVRLELTLKGFLDLCLLPLGYIAIWYSGRDLNPQNLLSESRAYAFSATRAYKVALLRRVPMQSLVRSTLSGAVGGTRTLTPFGTGF